MQGFVQGFMHGTLEILASEVNFHLKIACTSPPPNTGLLQAASEHPVARLLLDNYYDQIAGGGGSPQ